MKLRVIIPLGLIMAVLALTGCSNKNGTNETTTEIPNTTGTNDEMPLESQSGFSDYNDSINNGSDTITQETSNNDNLTNNINDEISEGVTQAGNITEGVIDGVSEGITQAGNFVEDIGEDISDVVTPNK